MEKEDASYGGSIHRSVRGCRGGLPGQLRRVDGVRILADEHGIIASSAGDFIEDYPRLAEGREFQRAMSVAAMRHLMEQVAVREGAIGKTNAIRALEKTS